MPDLPPVGSLWRHENDEIMLVWWAYQDGCVHACCAPCDPDKNDTPLVLFTKESWLSWQANADRIDKETA